MSIGPALEQIDLTAALAAFREQEERYGHTAATDAERKIRCFGGELVLRAQEIRDQLEPGARQDLRVAYRRTVKLIAFALATARRIRTEQQREI